MSNDKFNGVLQSMPKDGKKLYTEEQLAAQKDLSFNDGYKVGVNSLESKHKEKLDKFEKKARGFAEAICLLMNTLKNMGREELYFEIDNFICDEVLENLSDENDKNNNDFYEVCEKVGVYLKGLSQYKEDSESKLKDLNGDKDRLTKDKDRLTREVSKLKLKIDEYENVIAKHKEESEIAKHKEESEIAKHKEEKVRVKTKLWNKLFKNRG